MAERCRHPEAARERINAWADRCKQCAMVSVMVQGRTSLYRRWLRPDDPRIAASGHAGRQAVVELLIALTGNRKRRGAA